MFKRFILLGCSVLSLNLHASYYEVPQYKDLAKARLSSIECLAVNAYHESRSESDLANIAIFSVVMNRVSDKRYPIVYVKLCLRNMLSLGQVMV